MARAVQLEEVIDWKVLSRAKIATLKRPGKLEGIDDLGLRLAKAKRLLAYIQSGIATHQIQRDVEAQVQFPERGKRRRVKDYRPRRFLPLFRTSTRCDLGLQALWQRQADEHRSPRPYDWTA